MKLVILLLAILFVASSQTTDADHAEALLASLYNDAQQSLKELQDTWNVNGGLLKTNVESWEQELKEQTATCEAIQEKIDENDAAYEENQRLISWIGSTNKDKVELYNSIYKRRCEANRNYISSLKNDKILLRLIEFLRNALESKESMNFIERRKFMENFLQFIAMYKSKDTKSLLQMHIKLAQDDSTDDVDPNEFKVDNAFDVKQRTEEEIGNKHVDNDRDNISLDSYESGTRKDFSQYKAELLTLLDQFEEEVKNKLKKAQEDEVESGIAAAEFRLKLEHEMSDLDEELFIQTELTLQLQKTGEKLNIQHKSCIKSQERVQEAYDDAVSEYQGALKKYLAKEKEAKDELEVFEYVLNLYQSNVSSDKEFREQLDDHTADGKYEGSYNEREIDQIESIAQESANEQEETQAP